MSLSHASFGHQRSSDPDDRTPPAPDEATAPDVFNLIPPRAETFDRPNYERIYGLHRPVDLDTAKLEALYAKPPETEDTGPAINEPHIEAAAHDAARSDDPEYQDAEFEQASATTETPADSLTDNAFELRATEPRPPSSDPDLIEVETGPSPAGPTTKPPSQLDVTRLSVDDRGRLYWDGKRVEIRRRLAMSRAQIAGAGVVGLLVLITALGVTVQAAFTAHQWACQRGLIESYCAATSGVSPLARSMDIPS